MYKVNTKTADQMPDVFRVFLITTRLSTFLPEVTPETLKTHSDKNNEIYISLFVQITKVETNLIIFLLCLEVLQMFQYLSLL